MSGASLQVLSVVGARPQFVKLAPVARALAGAAANHIVVHTGQHYDAAMSDAFFSDLDIARPDVQLNIGSGTHGAQTGAMLGALEPVLSSHQPDWVLVYGDTNSTLAAAVAAVKLHLPLAHLEAGLRSHNRRMPEEHNRVLTDHAADLCLAPTSLAVTNLEAEGLASRTVQVGDVMADVCFEMRDRVTGIDFVATGLHAGEPFVLVTVHRAENTDDPDRLGRILKSLAALDRAVLLPVHPRLRDRCAQFGLSLTQGSLRPVEPLSYPAVVAAMTHADGVITDSGGLQKEAFLLRTPCTTLRTETEWPETLDDGWNVLDPECENVAALAGRTRPDVPQTYPYGRGQAAQEVVAALEQRMVDR